MSLTGTDKKCLAVEHAAFPEWLLLVSCHAPCVITVASVAHGLCILGNTFQAFHGQQFGVVTDVQDLSNVTEQHAFVCKAVQRAASRLFSSPVDLARRRSLATAALSC